MTAIAPEKARLADALAVHKVVARDHDSKLGIQGLVTAVLYGPDGKIKLISETHNLVTQVGDQWYGDRASGIVGSPVTLTALTNATTSVATTSGAHGFGVGDPVTIAGVTPSGYNGKWAISAISDTTHFSIYVGTALGAGTVFGTATGLTLPSLTGMRLGTGSTAVAKTGAGAAIVTYVSGSQKAMDGTYPQSALNASSRRITYQSSWAAGVATASGINEVVLTFETPITDVAGAAGNTIARALLSPVVNKGAADTLVVTWTQDLLGA